MKSNSTNLLLVLLGSFFIFSQCKKMKEKEFNDPEWRKESMEIAQGICSKLESCTRDEFLKLKKSLQNYAAAELMPDKCAEKNKKSKVYLLKGNDPNFIKQVTRECYSQIRKFSCEEIKSGSIKLDNSCEQMRVIQQEK